MRKQVLILILCVLILVGGVFAYLHLYKFKKYENNDTIKAVPTDASLIVEIEEPSRLANIFKNRINYSDDLLAFDWYRQFFSFISKIDSTTRYGELNQVIHLGDRTLTVSLHKTGKNAVTPLLLFKLKNKIEETALTDLLTSENKFWNITSRKYSSSVIYCINDSYLNFKFFLSYANGILVCGPSSLMIENSLRQLNSGFSLEEDASFKRLIKTAGSNCDANVFVNFNRFPEILHSLFDQQEFKRINVIKKFGDWGEFDVNFSSNVLSVNGFVYPALKGSDYSIIFENMGCATSDLLDVIPYNAKFFINYYIDNNKKLYNNFIKFLEESDVKVSFLNKLKSSTGRDGELVIKDVFTLIDEEFGLMASNTDPDKGMQYVAIVQTNSKSGALSKLKELMKVSDQFESSEVYKLDDNTKFPLYESKNIECVKLIFDYFLSDMPSQFFSFYDNYLLFADSKKALKQFIYANVLHKTIVNSKYFEKFVENFSYKDNVFIYSDVSDLNSVFKGKESFLLHSDKEGKDALSKFYGVGFQATRANNLLYLNAVLQYQPSKTIEPQTIWQSGLNGNILNKPALVENHYTHEKEIMVQDENYFLYLIAHNGKILWKKKLNTPVLSEIYQIDYYHNGKLQYLFNTADRLYLLDRNGNNVDKYPVNFSSKATNGLALFDYDKNRKYRIFVACEDRFTYVFNIKGGLIPGWKANKTEGIVKQPLQHFRMSGKDYIVFSDDKRNYILDRRGGERVSLTTQFVRNGNSMFYTEGNNSIVTSDREGNIRKVNLKDGSVTMIKVLDKKQDYYFTKDNITKDKGDEYIFLTKENLKVCDYRGKEIFDNNYDGDLQLMADVYTFSSSNKKIGLYDKKNELIYLVNNNGSLYHNFPLKGNSRFSIGFLTNSSNHFNLIVGGDNNYLYNYRIQ